MVSPMDSGGHSNSVLDCRGGRCSMASTGVEPPVVLGARSSQNDNDRNRGAYVVNGGKSVVARLEPWGCDSDVSCVNAHS